MNDDATTPPRHALVHVTPAGWTAELRTRPELGGHALVASWASRGWPLVARRRDARDRPGRVPLGLPLPPAHGKARLAFDLPRDAVATVAPPIALSDARAAAPDAWRRTIDALLALDARFGVTTRVFGSFAWAALTGLAYVTSGSDLDLLWPCTRDTPALLAALPAIEASAPGRLDGEVLGEHGAANWRELATAAEVLVKSERGVALVAARLFLHPAPPA